MDFFHVVCVGSNEFLFKALHRERLLTHIGFATTGFYSALSTPGIWKVFSPELSPDVPPWVLLIPTWFFCLIASEKITMSELSVVCCDQGFSTVFQDPHIYLSIYLKRTRIDSSSLSKTCPVGWGNRIRRLYPFRKVSSHNECRGYSRKPSDGEAPVLEFWRMWFIGSLPLLLGPF